MMKAIYLFIFLVNLFSFSSFVSAQETMEPAADKKDKPYSEATTLQDGVYFVNLKNKQVVEKKFLVQFGVHGMQVKPAGEIEFGTGHHHLIIDDKKIVKSGGIPTKAIIAKDDTHLHFGKGQEEVDLELKPGKHTLTLQFADGTHASYGPKWSKTITVIVK